MALSTSTMKLLYFFNTLFLCIKLYSSFRAPIKICKKYIVDWKSIARLRKFNLLTQTSGGVMRKLLIGLLTLGSFTVLANEIKNKTFKGEHATDNAHFFYIQNCIDKAANEALFKCLKRQYKDCEVIATNTELKKFSVFNTNYTRLHRKRVCKAVAEGIK